jgi:D-alanyl-D-alanine carboxypeptidase (penicillin-binding protein 5/6)
MEAPIKQGDKIGEVIIKFDDSIIANRPLYALKNAPKGSAYTRMKDEVLLTFKRWFSF